MEPSATEALSRALANRYTLERELGRGGMATVYLAQDLKHDRPVALKVLHPELAATLERVQQHGADGFYRGITADFIVAEMQRGGGSITQNVRSLRHWNCSADAKT